MHCELCNQHNLKPFYQYINKYCNKLYNRIYYRCHQCELIFLDKNLRLSLEEERHRYDQHNNTIKDASYLQFLDKLLVKLTPHLSSQSKGLDYGCGPSVVLAKYLEEKGFATTHYDPIFYPNPTALKKQYDFITCTEAMEHFFHPSTELQRIHNLLQTNAHLGVMTSLYEKPQDFPLWHYHRDITHVSFYSKNTMHWIAKYFNWKILFLSSRMVIFQKQ
ncbi:MAG: class I SAM-dependent methyltransferase [Bdellovibrionaceae bacterium]|nr:class I SAM-dependent methyltransferase [Pseudobdellovibrionaceae bacterium]